jgi:predicted nuclease of predicted toxin-antitoxin system
MLLLANENFPLASVVYLRTKGFDVIAIGIDNPGVSDDEVMQIAIANGRTILTFDRDYGELIFKHSYKPQGGVIYLRLNEYRPDEPGKLIEDLLNNQAIKFNNALTVIDKTGIRQRKY